MDLKEHIRSIPDYPKPGILFRDITPLLKHPEAFRTSVDRLTEYAVRRGAEVIVGIDARGFMLAAPVAYDLRKPLIPVRKRDKLPFDTHVVTYELEYGSDAVEVHTDALSGGERVLIVDDLLATGGTMAAAVRLLERAGGRIVGLALLVELTDLDGRARLRGYDVFSLIQF